MTHDSFRSFVPHPLTEYKILNEKKIGCHLIDKGHTLVCVCSDFVSGSNTGRETGRKRVVYNQVFLSYA